MATWAIGDVHGCYRSLRRLLARRTIGANDRLWFVGDLVNRGPRSLETLRFVADLGERAAVVLGNHDLHLLSVAAGAARSRGSDTLGPLLAARDRDELLRFLSSRPLLLVEGETVLVHGGLLAGWTRAAAARRARRAERALRDPGAAFPYLDSYRPRSRREPPRAGVDAEVLETIRVMTLLRTVSSRGEPIYDYTGPLAGRPRGSRAWFDAPGRRSAGARLIFGHWAALGLVVREDAVALDTGCAWGGALTALRLEDRRVEQTENVD
jgi:bis(5'-nucleosyl)-tetraphosphatase (symmetrical)